MGVEAHLVLASLSICPVQAIQYTILNAIIRIRHEKTRLFELFKAPNYVALSKLGNMLIVIPTQVLWLKRAYPMRELTEKNDNIV